MGCSAPAPLPRCGCVGDCARCPALLRVCLKALLGRLAALCALAMTAWRRAEPTLDASACFCKRAARRPPVQSFCLLCGTRQHSLHTAGTAEAPPVVCPEGGHRCSSCRVGWPAGIDPHALCCMAAGSKTAQLLSCAALLTSREDMRCYRSLRRQHARSSGLGWHLTAAGQAVQELGGRPVRSVS